MANTKNVIKIGGSLLFDENLDFKASLIKDFMQFIKNNLDRIDCVIVGGGKVARAYINALNQIAPNQAIQDIFGIRVSRVNSALLASIAGKDMAYQGVPESIEELLKIKSLQPGKVVFLGGLEVGQSTTSVACEVTEALDANMLVVGTDVDGIYTENPDNNPDAKKLDEVTLDELASILKLDTAQNQRAGEYRIFDTVSMSILRRSNISVRVIKGDVKAFEKALTGKEIGTLIKA